MEMVLRAAAAMVTLTAIADAFIGVPQGCVSCRAKTPSLKLVPSERPRRAALPRLPLRATLAAEAPGLDAMGALALGIKAVAVGVKGSKPIPKELLPQLLDAIEELDIRGPGSTTSAEERLASFLGTLFVKNEIADTDKVILRAVAARRPELATKGRRRGGCSSAQLLAMACPVDGEGRVSSGSAGLRSAAANLLDGKTLSEKEAFELGKRLYDESEPAPLRCLCAHVLRVRYETLDEWRGLLAAQETTLDTARFDRKNFVAPGNRKVVQLAEPFDGVNRSDMLGPLLAWHLQAKWNVVVVSVCGPSSGPKMGPNLLDVARELGPELAPFAHTSSAVSGHSGPLPTFGWYADQRDTSPPLAAWIPRRRNIIKRPYMATLEKYVDPFKADVLIASAFHPSFTEKMVMLAEAANFPACAMIRRGMEGSLGFSRGNDVDVSCSVKDSGGRYQRKLMTFPPDVTKADRLDRSVTAAQSAEKCRAYAIHGTSGDEEFDKRAGLTMAGVDQAMLWIMTHLPK